MKHSQANRLMWASFLVVFCGVGLSAQERPSAKLSPTELTIDRIFASDDFNEQRLGVFKWSRQTATYFTMAANEGGGKKNLVRVDCATDARQVVAPTESLIPPGGHEPLAVQGFEFSNDEQKLLIFTNSKRVWRQNTRGDYWLLDLASNQLKQLGGDALPSTMMFAKFSPDGSHIAYVRENNLYIQSLSDDRITRLTNDGSTTLINGTSDWVNEEELEIRDGFRWSPDSRSIAFWQFDTTGVPEFTMIDNTSEKYPRSIRFAYPKVGQKNSAARVGVVSIQNSAIQWIHVDGDSRENYIARMEWLPDGSSLILQQFNRLQNQNRVLLALASKSATSNAISTRSVFTETDQAWLENENPVRWIEPNKSILWISERDGWRHAYRAELDSGKLTCLTPGDFDLIQIESIDGDSGWLYYTASPDNPTQQYLFRVALKGGEAERLTPKSFSGWNEYDLDPRGQFAIHTHSTIASPPQASLIRLQGHQSVKLLVDNGALKKSLASLNQPKAEFFRVDIGHDMPLDGWCLKPTGFDGSKKYPVLFYVYGEPHGQTVRDSWQGSRGLWHMMLAQQGYVVASVDNRGTMSPRGRAWRKCVYRQIGILASQEQSLAVKSLLDRWTFADRNRVGVWGWSGGGSMSLNAIFRHPDLYHAAVAVAPVPDQLMYDTIYQERYMGLPDDNAEGYKQGSPITFAKNLKGQLLVIHGTGDDNCHYQGVELLINELVANNKPFSVMPYPGRSHGISEGNNTTRHFYALIARYFDENLRDRKKPTSAEQTDRSPIVGPWEQREILGWKVNLHERLRRETPDLLNRALELLTRQLEEIVRVVPPEAVVELRKVPLWFSPEYKGIGPRAEYHPGIEWLKENGRDPAMWQGVEFTNTRIFDAEVRRMPNLVLHELAHAFHDRVLGFERDAIKLAYKHAQSTGRYHSVQRQDSEGRLTRDKAYAMVNHKEYFAETTEAFFGRNDFEPFDQAALREFDPDMFHLLKTIWGKE
jgi:dipeptidyl-peptidase 4